ncbi:MAG: protein kinase, partial [Bradymonadaceae bacterium]
MSERPDNRHAYCPQCGTEFEGDAEYCPEDGTRLCTYTVPDDEGADGLVGKTLDDRFEIEGLLGEGGMGKVYAGRQLSVDRQVAVKILQPNLVDDEEAIKRFFRETRVISDLNHPNVIQLYDFGQEPETGVLYYVMEMVEGRELSALLEEEGGRRLAPPLALEIAHQTCRGLAEPHAEGIIHRDLKPENLMLVPMADGRFQVKVLDFGLAHGLQSETGLTSTGMVCGTVQYMSPQQAEGGDLGPETDIYALGVILFEMLTGQPMFGGDTPMEIMLKHVQNEPPDLSTLPIADDIPPELPELVRMMVRKKPADRPGDVLELQDRIDEIRNDHDYGSIRIDSDMRLAESLDEWMHDSTELESTASADSPPPAGSSEEDIDPLAETGAAPSPSGERPSAQISPEESSMEGVIPENTDDVRAELAEENR